MKNRVFFKKSAKLSDQTYGKIFLSAVVIFKNVFSKIGENLKNFTGSLATSWDKI